MTGWIPEWQREATELLAGDVTVAELAERRGAGRSGATYERNSAVVGPQPYEPETPMLFGRQDMADTSTCTDAVLLRDAKVIWDVNGYYKALSVPYPHRPATRGGLMAAHLAAGGLDRTWPTYALKQLLNPVTRREYDDMPLGQPYIDDYWNQWLDNEATKKALRRVAAGELDMEEFENGEAVRRIKHEEWGLAEQDGSAPPTRPRRPPQTVHLTWSYYLWRCSYRTASGCAPRLDTWRTLLVEAFRDRAMRLKFRVGIMAKQSHPWMRLEWAGHLVFFLNIDQEPTKEYAAQAVQHTQRELSGHTDTVTIKEINRGIA
jgi:hypothetical protein